MNKFYCHPVPSPAELALFFEAWRHWTFIDMAVRGWARVVPDMLGTGPWERLPNVKRLLDTVNARPAAQRAEALKTRHAFKTEVDDETRRALFPQNARLAGAPGA